MPSTEQVEGRPNRLIDETSPYLLQHAYNPVDWHPWGSEAFEKAVREDKPILLSIGYAACHWCHVMEKESFEDPETAEPMNRGFVCIKVDREERPDVDSVYMDAVQAMTGSGGWPMTVFLTPEGVPFYGGTYFPPEDRGGMPAFRKVLEGVSRAYRERRDEVVEGGRRLVEHIRQITEIPQSSEPLTDELLRAAVAEMGRAFDEVNGGFGGPPKFPQAPTLEMALRADRLGGETEMARLTLEKMALGGIYDQVGWGFHRYSVDERWLVPHFEKMLYDNALLARVYTHGWQKHSDPLFRRIATETLRYLLRDLKDPGGGFYSSEDADSEGEEGRFYVWSHEEFMEIAPGTEGFFGVTPGGNFEGRNILTAPGAQPPSDAVSLLREARGRRKRPGRDEKILTSWNGLTIAALAEAGAAFGEQEFVEAAAAAARFLLENSHGPQGLLHSYKDGAARIPGLLEDYAFLADGLMALWEATFETLWLTEARRLMEEAISRLADDPRGGFFETPDEGDPLIVRPKDLVESATPSPNGVAAQVLVKLALLFDSDDFRKRATEVLRVGRTHMERIPQAVPSLLCALDFYLSDAKEVVIAGEPAGPLTSVVWERYLPNRVMAHAASLDSPLTEAKEPQDGKAAAFVCRNYACEAPTSDPEVLAAMLER